MNTMNDTNDSMQQTQATQDGAAHCATAEHQAGARATKPTLSIRLRPEQIERLRQVAAVRAQEMRRFGLNVTATITGIVSYAIDREIERVLGAAPEPAADAPEPEPPAAATRPRKASARPETTIEAVHPRLLAALDAGKTQVEIAKFAHVDKSAVSTFKNQKKLWPAALKKLESALGKLGF